MALNDVQERTTTSLLPPAPVRTGLPNPHRLAVIPRSVQPVREFQPIPLGEKIAYFQRHDNQLHVLR